MRTGILHISLFLLLFSSMVNTIAQDVYADIRVHPVYSNSSLLSLVAYIRNDNQEVITDFSGKFAMSTGDAVFLADSISIKKGVGSLTAEVIATDDFLVSIKGIEGEILIALDEQQAVTEVEGTLNTSAVWTSDSDYRLTDDLIIPEGVSLKIEAGTKVFLDGKVNLFVHGELLAAGTQSEPVTFGPWEKAAPWGGIHLIAPSDSAIFEHCFFYMGGGNEDFIFGHSQSQPVLMTEQGSASLQHCYFLDNPGKALGGNTSTVDLKDCVVSRCDTGGEYVACKVSITDSWYMDMPDGDGIIEDDDNDASYFTGIHPTIPGFSVIKNCFYLTGEDDGIDHNGANLSIEGCWIDGFIHEGIAGSNSNLLKVYNTLIMNCEQGIEAGFWTPQVEVDHCTILYNDIGIRFGDNYSWGCEGHMKVTNSILYGNNDNVKNFDNLTQGPVEGAIDITYTLTNDPEYDSNPGCLSGTPEFDAHYNLIPGSVGTGLAMDGSNLGLIDPFMDIQNFPEVGEINLFPNPFSGKFTMSIRNENSMDIQVSVYNNIGACFYSMLIQQQATDNKEITINAAEWPDGLYVVVQSAEGKIISNNKIIKIEK